MARTLFFVLLVLTTVPALAEDKPAQEPAALVKARQDYEVKIKSAVDPITAAYLQKLDEMMKAYGAKGDLPSAQAVQKEIKNLTNTTPAVSIVGKWTWEQGLTAEFKEDGTCSHSNGSKGKWKCLDKKTRKYQCSMVGGFVAWILLSSDGNTFVVRSKEGHTWTAQKLPTDGQQ